MSNQLVDFFYRLLERLTPTIVGLLASFAGLILGQVQDLGVGSAIIVVIFLVFLLLGRWLGPQISVDWFKIQGQDKSRNSPERVSVDDKQVELELEFKVPDHQKELYIVFDVESYDLSVTQSDPVNFDREKGITYHSSINEFDLMLSLEMRPELDSAGTAPLEIVNKLNGKTIGKILLES